jgi:Zn-dependent peptidase ImmA (M78 family)
LDALEVADELQPMDFVGSLSVDRGIAETIGQLEEFLGFTKADFRRQRNTEDAFKALRDATERSGVYVLLLGNLGSHHTALSADTFRGFALADEYAPLIVVNDGDARAAWSFTLLHELVHVGLGRSGISGYDSPQRIERFCDDVSSGFLLSADELRRIPSLQTLPVEDAVAEISEFASERNLSRKMVAYNLMRRGQITADLYRRIAKHLDDERNEQRQGQPARPINYYVVRRHRLGPGLVSLVNRMVLSGAISSTKAGRVLGVKPTSVGRLFGDMA